MEDDHHRSGRLRDPPGGGLGGWQVEDLPQEQLQPARPVSIRVLLCRIMNSHVQCKEEEIVLKSQEMSESGGGGGEGEVEGWRE